MPALDHEKTDETRVLGEVLGGCSEAVLPRSGRGALGLIPLVLLAAGCAAKQFPETAPAPTQIPEASIVLYLIGDAGKATRESPVIVQLKREVAQRSRDSEVVVAFLGDNIYSSGLHEPTHPHHREDVEHLEAQIDVLRGTPATGIFIPGNHDWGYSGERGLAQIQRQGAYLAAAAEGGVDVALIPTAGCPGPALLRVGPSVLLVMLETDLWLRDQVPVQGCPNASTEDAVNSLRRALQENAASDSRHVIVLAHHPLRSRGPHGGYFSARDYLFPLTNLWAPLYLPVPLLYPLVRRLGTSSQDLANPRYAKMREQLAAVFSEFPNDPLVYGAGHEHNLQVLSGDGHGVGYILVSGAGSKLSDLGKGNAAFTAGRQQREQGYMRLEFLRDGRVLLSVITDGTASCKGPDSCRPEPAVRYWSWLTGE